MPDTVERRPYLNIVRWVPWMVVLLDLLALAACAVIMLHTNTDVGYLPSLLGFGLFPLAGALILWKQPRNAVGWLSAALGLLFVFNELLSLYSNLALILQPGAWPLGGLSSWFAAWLWQIGYSMAISLIIVIPNGRPPSRRWNALLWASIVVTLPVLALNMALLWPYRGLTLLLAESDMNRLPVGSFLTQEMVIWQGVIIFLVILSVTGLFLRFFSARGVERQQLKWIMMACALVPLNLIIGLVHETAPSPWISAADQATNLLSVVAFPISFAFAITRYRLYEIDVIIRRTLLYSALTIVLGLVYLGSVISIQAALTWITGQGSTVSVVLSTLVIAALFAPLRRRLQEVIDRRFYRQKYNADLMLERFAASQREMLELEQYNAHLLHIVAETFQPEFVQLTMVRQAEGKHG